MQAIETTEKAPPYQERIQAPILQFACEALDDYLKNNRDVALDLFGLSEGSFDTHLKQRAVADIVEEISDYLNRNREFIEQLMRDPGFDDGFVPYDEFVPSIAYEKAKTVCGNLERESKANIDSLTGLPNRRAFEERLRVEIARHKRIEQSEKEEEPLCMLFIDIDNFTEINNTHGHQAGDKVLEETASRLSQVLRGSDLAARTGGDEIVMLLLNTNTDEASIAAYRVSEAINGRTFTVGTNGSSKTIKVTVSIGVSQFAGAKEDSDGSDMYDAADKNLYVLKNGNRRGNIACQGKIIDKEEIRQKLNKGIAEQLEDDLSPHTGARLRLVRSEEAEAAV